MPVGTSAFVPGVGGAVGQLVSFQPIGDTVPAREEEGHKYRKNVKVGAVVKVSVKMSNDHLPPHLRYTRVRRPSKRTRSSGWTRRTKSPDPVRTGRVPPRPWTARRARARRIR